MISGAMQIPGCLVTRIVVVSGGGSAANALPTRPSSLAASDSAVRK
jgi:hypothetical protein